MARVLKKNFFAAPLTGAPLCFKEIKPNRTHYACRPYILKNECLVLFLGIHLNIFWNLAMIEHFFLHIEHF